MAVKRIVILIFFVSVLACSDNPPTPPPNTPPDATPSEPGTLPTTQVTCGGKSSTSAKSITVHIQDGYTRCISDKTVTAENEQEALTCLSGDLRGGNTAVKDEQIKSFVLATWKKADPMGTCKGTVVASTAGADAEKCKSVTSTDGYKYVVDGANPTAPAVTTFCSHCTRNGC